MRRPEEFVTTWLAVLAVAIAASIAWADVSMPGSYGAGWIEVTVPRPAGGSLEALLFYPASGSGSDAVYDGSGGPYPAVSFGHGWITAVTRYQSTLEHLASWGYFVIASRSYGGLFPDHGAFADDLRWCLTYLDEQEADPASWLHQQVNTAAFGISGHSMGGGASILAAERDGRIRAVANMAAAETNPSAIDAISRVLVPVLLIAGDRDGIVPPPAHTIPMYDVAAAPRRLPILDGGWHCGFLDSSFFGCDTGPLPREDQLALTRGVLTAFFNLYLKRDHDAWRPVWGPELLDQPLIDNARADPGITLEPDTPILSGDPGQAVQFAVRLTNAGAQAMSYSLFVEDNAWSTVPLPPQTPVLGPGDSAMVTVVVEIPAGVGVAVDSALLSARSDLDGGTRGYVGLTTERRPAAPCNRADVAPPFGVLDLADINAFTAGFLAQEPFADLNQDGLHDLADIAEFVDGFMAGCP